MKITVSATVPALLFGLRLAASVCLSLYVAFWLQLDNPYWAAASAAAVSQPSLGASLRKGWYRMVGTVVGAVFIVALTACFVQNRAAFFVTLALWGAGCAFAATVLHNFSSYAAALAGYTAAIVASDQLGATGGPDGNAFMFAVTRASEICIGIVCAGVILAATDFGGARRRLASLLAEVTQQLTNRFVGSLAAAGPEAADTRPMRREFIRQVIALDPAIEQAIGESSQLRQNSPRLQRAVLGLVDALAGWRNVASHLVQLSRQRQPQDATSAVLHCISQDLRAGQPPWLTNPAGLLQSSQNSVRALLRAPAGTPSHQLLTDQTAKVLMGITQALRGLALLVYRRPGPRSKCGCHRGAGATRPGFGGYRAGRPLAATRVACAGQRSSPVGGSRPTRALLRRGSARMRLEEVNLFGVYVAPISIMIGAAWIVTLTLRRVADRFGLLRYVWNPSLFVCAVYVILLATIVLFCAH